MNWIKILNRIAQVSIVASLLIVHFDMIIDGHEFYNIKLGEVIWKYGFVNHDMFSFVELTNFSVPDWLSNVLFYLVHKTSGFFSLKLFKVIYGVFLFLMLKYFF
jgi:hypothetical protein